MRGKATIGVVFRGARRPISTTSYIDRTHDLEPSTMNSCRKPLLTALVITALGLSAHAQVCNLQELKSARVVVKPPVPSLVLTNTTLKFSSELFPVIPLQAPKPEATNVQCAPRISAFYVYVASTSAALDALVRSASAQPDFQAAGVVRHTATKSRAGNTFGCAAVLPASTLPAPGTTMHCRVAKRLTNPPSRDVLVFSSNYTFVIPGTTGANAGPDQTVTVGNAATLSATIPTGNAPYSFQWVLVSGTATIVSPTAPTTQVTGLALGVNTFQVHVISANGATTSDQVKVTVVPLR